MHDPALQDPLYWAHLSCSAIDVNGSWLCNLLAAARQV
jgi:hypothetical protein